MNNFVSQFVIVFKGFLMGIAGIIPGVSSGTVAVIVKVYDHIILNVDKVIKSRFTDFKALTFLLLVHKNVILLYALVKQKVMMVLVILKERYFSLKWIYK